MILNLIIAVITNFFGALDNFLPNVTVPTWFTTHATAGIVTTLGDLMGSLSSVLPIDAFLTVLQSLLAFLPVAITYMIFDWVWKHLPTIAGTGT